jgi:hypothetical protein
MRVSVGLHSLGKGSFLFCQFGIHADERTLAFGGEGLGQDGLPMVDEMRPEVERGFHRCALNSA